MILIDQYLLFKIRYYVVLNCGTANEINGALYHDMALSMETRLKRKLTSNFIFFHWSAPNPSEKMMIMYLPTIWVFTWYDSMSRDCHMTPFLSKSSLLCRSWHVSNPAEVLSRLFILCGHAEFTDILLYREWILIIELKTSCGTIGLEASLKFKGKRPRVKGTGNRSSQCESSRYLIVVLLCTSKDASLQHVLISLRVNYSHWY